MRSFAFAMILLLAAPFVLVGLVGLAAAVFPPPFEADFCRGPGLTVSAILLLIGAAIVLSAFVLRRTGDR